MSRPITDPRERLEQIAGWYDSRIDFDYHLIRYSTQVIMDHAQGPRVLEMGCASGVMTEELSRLFADVVVVDGSVRYIEQVRSIVSPNVSFCHSLFEDFVPRGTFNSIIMARVLEHLDDPEGILRRAATWLSPGGAIHIIVPNALSLHRRIGKAMGLIIQLDELNQRDHQVGHRRVYTPTTLREQLEAAGLTPVDMTGIFLKPLSNAQMTSWSSEILDALYEVGKELPEYCAEIYARCAPIAAPVPSSQDIPRASRVER